MDDTFEEMIEVFRRIGVTVRHVHLGGGGGSLARINGIRQLFVDVDADPRDQLEQTARALALLPEAQTMFIRPDVREIVEGLNS